MFLKIYLIILIKICILMEHLTSCSLLSKNKKLPYQLPQIGEKYEDYTKKVLPNTNNLKHFIGRSRFSIDKPKHVKMTAKEFYDTVYNVKFIQLPNLGPYNYDDYVVRIKDFCRNDYKSYSVFLVDNTVNEFVIYLNKLVTNIKNIVVKEKTEGSLSCDDLLVCFKLQSDKKIKDCIDVELSGYDKVNIFYQFVATFREGVNEVTFIKDGGVKFDYKMLPILNEILNKKLNEFILNGKRDVKKLYAGYLGVNIDTKESIKKCNQTYKPLDRTTYTARKIGYYLFPRKGDKSLDVLKRRRIQFIYHLRTFFKEMGILNDKIFDSLENASKNIESAEYKNYFNDVSKLRVIENESYESYAMRIMAQEYYPLPIKLWKSDMKNIPDRE